MNVLSKKIAKNLRQQGFYLHRDIKQSMKNELSRIRERVKKTPQSL
jgi:hypothetical protein